MSTNFRGNQVNIKGNDWNNRIPSQNAFFSLKLQTLALDLHPKFVRKRKTILLKFKPKHIIHTNSFFFLLMNAHICKILLHDSVTDIKNPNRRRHIVSPLI